MNMEFLSVVSPPIDIFHAETAKYMVNVIKTLTINE